MALILAFYNVYENLFVMKWQKWQKRDRESEYLSLTVRFNFVKHDQKHRTKLSLLTSGVLFCSPQTPHSTLYFFSFSSSPWKFSLKPGSSQRIIPIGANLLWLVRFLTTPPIYYLPLNTLPVFFPAVFCSPQAFN